jgi:hypothetical protein
VKRTTAEAIVEGQPLLNLAEDDREAVAEALAEMMLAALERDDGRDEA